VTVYKNSKPWLVIAPAQPYSAESSLSADRDIKDEALRLAAQVDDEYYDVFEALAK